MTPTTVSERTRPPDAPEDQLDPELLPAAYAMLLHRFDRLLAAAQAFVAADAIGQRSAKGWLTEHLAELGELPERGAHPRQFVPCEGDDVPVWGIR